MLACLSGERGDRKEGKPGSERDDRAIHGCALDRLFRTVGRRGSRNLRLRTLRASRALSKNSSPAIGLKRDVKRVGARYPKTASVGPCQGGPYQSLRLFEPGGAL